MGLGQDANFLAKSWGGDAPNGCEKGIQADLQSVTCGCLASVLHTALQSTTDA